MRNRLIHGYDFVDYDVLWQTLVEDLPVLIRVLDEFLREVAGTSTETAVCPS